MKPTRTENNKAPKSGAIRKWSIPQEEIKKIAKKLTEKQVIKEVQAPAIEPVTPWNYEVYAWYIQAHIDEHGTYTESVETLKKLFPQCKHVYHAVANLKRVYGINYRYSDLWEYVFFDGETKDEIIDRLEWIEESNNMRVRELTDKLQTIEQEKTTWESSARYLSQANSERHERYTSDIKEQQEVIHDLQSDLYNTKYQKNQSLLLAILLLIYIMVSNYYG